MGSGRLWSLQELCPQKPGSIRGTSLGLSSGNFWVQRFLKSSWILVLSKSLGFEALAQKIISRSNHSWKKVLSFQNIGFLHLQSTWLTLTSWALTTWRYHEDELSQDLVHEILTQSKVFLFNLPRISDFNLPVPELTCPFLAHMR